ncbi:MAG TPA: aminopeptidase N [Azoarcus sp.]|nr:aminopeptidase N [Azoarcus sp.]
MDNSLSPVAIRRADYQPLAWRIDTVELHFDLGADVTQIKSRLVCVKKRGEEGPLMLYGEDLELISLKVDGSEADDWMQHSAAGIELDLPGQVAVVEVVTRVNPSANTTLSGLYASQNGLFTQCEAEGFRRMTYFPDRPDVMSRYTVRIEGDRKLYPVLLSNGNLKDSGDLPDGRHYAVWEDPFPKPSYLFALVAAELEVLERKTKTLSGREVLLQVWVEPGNLDRASHAMDSLVNSMRWDEETFGLELDLDRFMIVAVGDFNMGAMENKGLNIFNSRFVFARPDTATDADYEGIESVVAHEYFHNWTGNRVTCRDWFQLTLKEGLTVFRDQQFSADMLARAAGAERAASARAVKRIDDVRVLRTVQFAEDAGPMAHPIRPESYQEINNFYTATVYEKGAEVIRMQHTLLGAEGFRKGMDLYFERHDGQAVTCDDFVTAMADANGRDMSQFMRWYSQAGTPVVRAHGHWDAAAKSYTLTLSQSISAPSAGTEHSPLVIPVAVGLIAPDGVDLPLRLEGEGAAGGTTRVLELVENVQKFVFEEIPVEPVPSVLRGFSAPVMLDIDEDNVRLAFRMAHDADPCNRWDAVQRFAERVVLAHAADPNTPIPESFLDAWGKLLADESLEPAFLALAATLPSEAWLLERMKEADPARLRATLIQVHRVLGERFAAQWLALYERFAVTGEYRYHPGDAGRRALRNLALRYLAAANNADGLSHAEQQFNRAGNMTEHFGALAALVHSASPAKQSALAMFYQRFENDALVLDKWFALQAGAWRWEQDAAPTLERVRALMQDPAFKITNPNKVYALLGTFFRGNPAEFHTLDGHAFWAEQIVELDRRNPQVASRMARSLENWRRYTPQLQASIRTQLERVRDTHGLSADVAEVVGKALEG